MKEGIPVASEAKEANAAVIVQSVLPPELAAELRAKAELERRSISATIRNALEDSLRRDAVGKPGPPT